MNPARPRNSLIALDLLRFVAASLVMLFHYYAVWLHDQDPLVLRLLDGVARIRPTDWITPHGWVGVPIFFVLSGYVISASAGRGDAADFAWRRWLRLWPAAVLCTVLTAFVLILHQVAPADLARPALASALLWPGEPLIDPSYWTLGIECSFYALVGLLLAIGKWRPGKVARGLMLVSVAYWMIMLAMQFSSMNERNRVEELALLRHGCLFALGIMIQLRHSEEPGLPLSWLAPALFASLISVLFSALMTAKLGLPCKPLVAMAMFLCGVGVIAGAPRLQAPLASLRIARAALWLGLATYPLYLLHQRVGFAMIGDLARAGLDRRLAIPLVMAAMIAAALVIANIIEPAIRGLLNDARRRWQIQPAATMPWPSPR